MKKIILTVAAIFAFGWANAQDVEGRGFKKGDMFVEGALSVRSGNVNQGPGDLKTGYAITPTIGYLIEDKIAVGGNLSLGGGKFYGENSDGVHKFTTFGIGAFARYYFLTLGDKKSFNAYGNLGLGYATTTNKDINDNEVDKPNGLTAHLDLGTNYFLTNNWALTFTLTNLISYDTLSKGGSTNSGLNMQVGTVNNPFAAATFGLLYKW